MTKLEIKKVGLFLHVNIQKIYQSFTHGKVVRVWSVRRRWSFRNQDSLIGIFLKRNHSFAKGTDIVSTPFSVLTLIAFFYKRIPYTEKSLVAPVSCTAFHLLENLFIKHLRQLNVYIFFLVKLCNRIGKLPKNLSKIVRRHQNNR